MINSEAFKKMKDHVMIINTSRGAIINEDDFIAALESGKVEAAGVMGNGSKILEAIPS